MKSDDSYRDNINSCKVVSKFFSNNLVMDESFNKIKKENQNTSKKVQSKAKKIKKKPKKGIKGQKDIRTLIKSKKNELLTYAKDFDLICKQSGIDVDSEQLQLAIALSKSIQDSKSTCHDGTDTEKSLTCNQRRTKIRTTLQEYGFQTTAAPSKKNKRYRKQYKLVLTSDTEKQQRIADKYAQILLNISISKTNEEILYENGNVKSYLYNLTTNAPYDFIRNDEIFYVDDLVPKSLQKKHIFKDWSTIPGRPVSPNVERQDVSFNDIECSQEELVKLLSGSLDIAHDIVKRNSGNSNCKSKVVSNNIISESVVETENSIKSKSTDGLADAFFENKTIGDNLIKSVDICHNKSHNMSELTNRSFSPDLFDDEVTIIMESSSSNKISGQEGISDSTVMVKEQNDFMELTKCISNMNNSHSNSKHIVSLSQGSNRTRLNTNDFMDLTECVPGCSQKMTNNLQNACSYKESNENCSIIKTTNYIEIKDQAAKCTNEKSLDDTIIMVDEDYSNIDTGNKYNIPHLFSKENLVIDLVENIYTSSRVSNTRTKLSDSTKQTFENDKDKNIFSKDNRIINNLEYGSIETIHDPYKSNNDVDLDTVDLTQPCNSVPYLNVLSKKSVIDYEMRTESDIVSNTEMCRSLNHNKEESRNGNKKSNNLEDHMDLTQSSNSDDYFQEVAHDTYSPKSVDNINVFSNEHNSIIIVDNETEGNNEIVDCVEPCNVHSTQNNCDSSNLNIISVSNQNTEPSTRNDASIGLDNENDHEFDNLIESVSKSKQDKSQIFEFYKEKHSVNQVNNEVKDLAQNYGLLHNKLCGSSNIMETENINDDAHNTSASSSIGDDSCIIEVKDINKQMKSNKKSHDIYRSINVGTVSLETNIKENHSLVDVDILDVDIIRTSHLSCINDDRNSQNNDIDLTQQSDCSEDSICYSKIVDVADELGKRNNVSIDYDEVSNRTNNTREYETNSTFSNNKCGSNDEGISGSSQHAEVFELSDNEFNYSINQHKQDNDTLDLEQAKFDIGGISVIDEFLNRNSLPRRSKLRCSCNSNEPNTTDNEVSSCFPIQNNSNGIVIKESKSYEEVTTVEISSPLKSRSDDNMLIAKTPKNDNYIIKTNEVTPMPNYENMTSPERNDELDKFGIKPLKRKRAIQILTHIYNQTHPLMEVICNDESSSQSKIRRKNNAECFPRRDITSQIESAMAKNSAEPFDDILEILETESPKKSSKSFNELTDTSYRLLRKTSDKENDVCEQTTLTPDIRNIECSPEDWVFQKREKAKVHSCRLPLHIAFHNYVSTSTALREAILKYEPINIDEIHKGLVANGYRYNPKDLLKFMDRKCITVKTADNTRKNKNT